MPKHPSAGAPAGTIIRVHKDGPQVHASKGKRWTDQAETKFLDALGASCNVRYAAAQAGFSAVAIYKRRAADPAFQQRWDVALAQGRARLEMLLIQRATEALEGYVPDPDTPFRDMSVKDAIAILQLYRAPVTGEGKHPGWRARSRSLDEMRRSILTKFEAIEAMRRKRTGEDDDT